jgi:hypothetical protein
VETPWSAVDRGNCKSDPEAKTAAPGLKSGHPTLLRRKAAGVGGIVASATFLSTENSRGLKP